MALTKYRLLVPMGANEAPLTKDTILDAAEQVFRRYGPDKTSVVDIAKALQVSHGTLYRHFENKSALREAVTERWLHTSIIIPLESVANETEGSAVERLRLWLDNLIEIKRKFALEDSEMFLMYAAVAATEVAMIADHVNRLIGQLAQIIDRGIESKAFKPGQPQTLARAIFLATVKFHHPLHAQGWTAETIEEDFEIVWRMLLVGLTA